MLRTWSNERSGVSLCGIQIWTVEVSYRPCNQAERHSSSTMKLWPSLYLHFPLERLITITSLLEYLKDAVSDAVGDSSSRRSRFALFSFFCFFRFFSPLSATEKDYRCIICWYITQMHKIQIRGSKLCTKWRLLAQSFCHKINPLQSWRILLQSPNERLPQRQEYLLLQLDAFLCWKLVNEERKLPEIQNAHERCNSSPWHSKMYCACANAFLNENITQTITLMRKTSRQSQYLVLRMLPPCVSKWDEINLTFIHIESIPRHRCCTRNPRCEIAASVWQIEPPVNASSKANCNLMGEGVNGHGSHKLRTKAVMNLLTMLLMVGTHTPNLVTTTALHCACCRRTFNVIRQSVQAKNLPWEWISRYVHDGRRYFLAFFGKNSTAKLSKWIIFNEQ